jgi:hypothetical protein
MRPANQYGVDPTGASDSGPKLQNAINDTPRGGDILQLGPGTFKIESAVLANLTGQSLVIRGCGPVTKLWPQMNDYEDMITINNTPGGGICGLENLSIIGNKVLDPDDPQDTPQCYRSVVLGGTFGAPLLRRVGFYGVYAKGSIAYMGNGATSALVDNCDWEGCISLGDTGIDPQSLLELNIIFGATVRDSRFVVPGYYAEQALSASNARQAIRVRHYDVREGPYTGSQARIVGCFFDNPGLACISTLEPDGNPNGPCSPIFFTSTSSAYGFRSPPTIPVWPRPTGTATGGYPLEYTFQIRCDVGGARGAASFSTRFQDSGFGGGFTSWTSQGVVNSFTVNGITFTVPASGTFVNGQIYQCYVIGNARLRQLVVEKCSAVSKGGTPGIIASQVDSLVVSDFDFDSASSAIAVDMYDVDVAKILRPQIRGHKIKAEPASFGFNANSYVYVEDPNTGAVLDLDSATKWEKSIKGVVTTGP